MQLNQRQKEQLGGLFIASLGVLMIFRNWTTAIDQGYFYKGTTFFGPASLILGLALLLIPSYKLERQNKGEDTSHLKGFSQLTPRWKIILGLAILAGIFNLYLLGYFKV